MSIISLEDDRTLASVKAFSLTGRLNFFSASLHSRGLHAEASAMTDAMIEIEALRHLTSATKHESAQRVKADR